MSDLFGKFVDLAGVDFKAYLEPSPDLCVVRSSTVVVEAKGGARLEVSVPDGWSEADCLAFLVGCAGVINGFRGMSERLRS